MPVLVGTLDGVYRASSEDLSDLERVLNPGETRGVHTFGEAGIFATTKTGLYHSADHGSSWSRRPVPRPEVYAVAVSPDGSRTYAGTHPAHVYSSTNGGHSWEESTNFRDLPSRETWHTPRHRGAAHVRCLGVHPDQPELLVAGVEVGGLHVSDDHGATWTERRAGLDHERPDDLQYDVHDVSVISPDEYLASCGGGLFRTRDAGRSWTRLDTGIRESYFNETTVHDGTIYTAAQTLPPTLPIDRRYDAKRMQAGLFESTDGGDTLTRQPYPGEPHEYVTAWTVTDDQVLAGTTGGRLVTRTADGWVTTGRAPAWIRSLADV